ncbi:MAG: SusC/RagA family TonB-linked outer membrane protein [Bacteroidaceae bacterium]|nr:SusC/RagA family TonB-linked outer membrane protein [Bacteroidaceae bacterium]
MIKIKHLFLLVLFGTLSSAAFAQKSARISGTITSDAEGPLIMVNITERDKSNRIIEASATDFEGNFSMVVKNTGNILEISYIGYKTQRIEIGNRTVFNIKMEEDNVLDAVEIVAQQRQRTGGLDILEREMTHATQKVNMDEMEGLSFTSVDQALQGQVAGLDIVFGSGDVGSGTQMRLRGNSMLEGDATPLIVVDDNPLDVDQGSFDLTSATNESFAELLMINPEDIAEIEVLKDAASCAAWGSRGANGVIKIKTRRGKRGPTRVNFSYKFKDKWTPSGFNLLNGDDYTMLIKQALYNRDQQGVSIDELNYDQDFPEWRNYDNNSDWVEAVSKHGYTNDYSLNLSGGGEKATFRIAGGYTNETGQVVGQNLNRFTTRLALDYYVSERIKVIADFSFTYNKNRQNTGSPLYSALLMMPNMSIYTEDKNGNKLDEYYTMLEYANPNELEKSIFGTKNPLGEADLAKQYATNYSITPQITFEYNLLGLEDNQTQLKYRGMVNLSASTATNTKYMPAELSTDDWISTDKNKSESYDSKSLYFTTRHELVFTPYLGNRDHYLTASGRFELSTGSGNSQNAVTIGLPTGNISSSTVGSKLEGTSTSKWESRNVNFLLDAHYSYKSKYMLRVTARAEGHTAMGDDRKWAIYPAISGRWNISDESWMEWSKPVLSMLSLRPGFGMDGHAPGENKTFNSYASYGYSYLGMAGYMMEGIRLTDLRRSDKREWNIGSDFGFFKDLITGSFNYYDGTTYDQIIGGYKIPSSTGYSSLAYKNSGTVRNYGWELNLSANNIKLAKDLSLSLYFNIGNNYNEIVELEEAYLEDKNGKYDAPQNSKYLPYIQTGTPSGAIYGFRYKGVYRYSYKNWEKALAVEQAEKDKVARGEKDFADERLWSCPIVRDAEGKVIYEADGTPKKLSLFYDNESFTSYGGYEFRGGDAIYEDVNHDGTINQLDIVYLGNSNPAAQGGFGLTLRYKKFSLKANFAYRLHVDVVNSARMSFENMATFDNQSIAVNWRWRKEGDVTEIPRAVYGSGNAFNYLGSDRYVEDASYVRCNNIQLSYSFEPSLIKKIGLKQLNLYASVDNVYCWTKYTGLEPEIASGSDGIAYDNSRTPRPRSYTLTLSLGF